MAAIGKFLAGLGDFIISIGKFIVDFFMDLIYVIGLLAQFLIEIPGYFSWLPSEAVTLLVLIFSVVVIYMILNRK